MPVGTREETRIIQRIFVLVVIPLVLCVVMGVQLSNKNENVREKIQDVQKNIERYVAKKGAIPTMQRIMKAKANFESMKEYYDSIVSLAIVKPIAPPAEVVEKGVYFKERLYVVQKQISERALANEVAVPQTIGFSEALPLEADVPRLLRKLETVDTVITTAITAHVEAITVIKLMDDKRGESKESAIPFTEIGVRVDMMCSYDVCVAVLHALGTAKPFLVVKDISIKPAKEGRVDCSVIVSRLIDERTV